MAGVKKKALYMRLFTNANIRNAFKHRRQYCSEANNLHFEPLIK
jgi:hypothetical protein